MTTPLGPEAPAVERASDGAVYVAASGDTPVLEQQELEGEEAAAATPPARLRVTSILAPDFYGMTVREAVAEGVALGLRLETVGDGVALSQDPPAGTPLAAGSRVRLHFGRLAAQARVAR